ncbi:hypothetical protein MTX78_16475 [Hymenobacter tibetensis]|uniref:Lipoprotein n=1 Tax=Hymenobacter tibetensis TaxID=497967 RepID=A0ABY4CVC0_9BACT|nr:hypothetical protein [Hymenobacter tibetensis]UOG73707.1 hypothetical protein MTX78_16475 [Hymenobacter tibetensis]
MKRFPHLLALLAIASLSACDPQNSPGKDPQRSEDFSQNPPATANETDRDSISGGQRVEKPIGKGSAADQKTSGSDSYQAAPGDRSSPTSQMPTNSEELKGNARETE